MISAWAWAGSIRRIGGTVANPGRSAQTGQATTAVPALSDPTTDRAVRNLARTVDELQRHRALGLRVIPDVVLPDATDVTIAHRLGRAPIWVGHSCPRGGSTGGAVLEQRPAGGDRARAVVLRAVGYGATITIDLLVL